MKHDNCSSYVDVMFIHRKTPCSAHKINYGGLDLCSILSWPNIPYMVGTGISTLVKIMKTCPYFKEKQSEPETNLGFETYKSSL
jgi:hypothetical protein